MLGNKYTHILQWVSFLCVQPQRCRTQVTISCWINPGAFIVANKLLFASCVAIAMLMLDNPA